MARSRKPKVPPTETSWVVTKMEKSASPAREPLIPKSARMNEGAVEVARVPARAGVSVGKPSRVVTSHLRSKVAYSPTSNTVGASGGNFYHPEMSPDMMELPQSLNEKRNYYRFFYQSDPFVGQAVDLHTELPLSKVRLGTPKAKDEELARKSLEFCQRWAKKVGLLHRLIEIVHDYNLLGEAFVFCEDVTPDMPEDITHETVRDMDAHGNLAEVSVKRHDAEDRAYRWLKKNYFGWSAIRVLPPEQIHMDSFPFTDEKLIELIPDTKTRDIIDRAQAGDPNARRIAQSMPEDVVAAISSGHNIPLNTDPDAGSFCYYLARKKSQYEPRGHSILERCMRVLVYRDKLRQAQTSISSRHMTPIRLIWCEDGSNVDVDAIREQVDLALQDPDYSIITNFELHWEEMGSQQRLLELTGEYEMTDRQLYAGLGVTESLLSGESSYSGDRINLEVINTRYMLLREELQDMVESKILEPMCRRMGFIEVDEDGNETVISPSLSFTRLALRDNADTFDALFNLYNKGSLDVDVILELLNIDPHTTNEKLKRDVFTLSDATFNEVLRGIYSEAGRKLAEDSDVVARIAEHLKLKYSPKKEEEAGRF
jgi:hypothetical protein